MKWLLFRLIVFTGLVFWFSSASCGESTEPVEVIKIESISYSAGSLGKESIVFRLSAPVDTKIFAIKGEKPRLVIDFPGALFSGKNLIQIADGKLATAIRTGIHQEPKAKIRVVVDLTTDTDIRYSADFSTDNNILVVTLESIPAGDDKVVTSEKAQPEVKKELPSQKELEARPLDEKPVPPVFSVQEKKKVSPVVTPPVSAVPVILDITFDDSSNRGEMVLFRLNDFFPPTVSAIEKDNPRVLCDFSNMRLDKDVQEEIFANGKYVERIRTTVHNNPDKVQVVIDLSPDRDYDLQQVFFKNDNLFVLIVNELPLEKKAQ